MTVKDKSNELCTGCGLCAKICPHHSITMSPNSEGFLYPVINNETCIACGLCFNKCPIEDNLRFHHMERKYFSLYSKDEHDLLVSSSGGVFLVLAKNVIKNGGVVVGCVYDDNTVACHVCTNDLNIVYQMCGSKYVQSRADQTYGEVKTYLENGVKVLFTGTACQVEALRAFLNIDYENLITIDILCHGVPSPLYFKKFTDYYARKYKGKITSVEFRNKEKRGWGSEHRTCIRFIDKKGNENKKWPILPKYFCHFFYGDDLRLSCYKCKYAQSERISDITIGDFWGYWQKYKKFFYDGISVCSVNTESGLALLNEVCEGFEFIEELSESEAKGSNTNFYHPVVEPIARKTFYKNIQDKKYNNIGKFLVLKDKTLFKKYLKSIYGAFFPEFAKRFLHKIKR